ncbi:unnamed protein product [Ambrosiozyma monospora]|uniref:Unnamed protein product n=1 Tax=Ambrosiozyma monospora TaxID=43982 RepID=A0ACB5U4K7_AMBMO|nr:unnamed protein product [Ambrosiozyma monospora]
MRLPIKTSKNKDNKWSLFNGLPYYSKEIVDKHIRDLNLKKSNANNSAIFNASHFSTQFNETVDDVEYLHGQVVLNQFLNNKRMMRNYQWLEYYVDMVDQSDLSKGVDTSYKQATVRSLKQFQKYMAKKENKIKEIRKLKSEKIELLKQKQHERTVAREKKELEERLKQQQKEVEEAQKATADALIQNGVGEGGPMREKMIMLMVRLVEMLNLKTTTLTE